MIDLSQMIGRRRTQGTKLSAVSPTTVYSADRSSPAIAEGLWLNNISAAAVDATVSWFDADADADGEVYALLSTFSVPAKTEQWFNLHGLALDGGDEIRVTAGTINVLHVTIIVSEFSR